MGQQYSCCWKNDQVKQYLLLLVKLFGQPYIYVGKPGGVALWRSAELQKPGVTLFGMPVCFDKVMIYDNPVVHSYPKPHSDFVWTYVKVALTKDQVCSLAQVTDSIGYDYLNQLLYVRCGSLDMNIATLKLCTDIALQKISVSDAISLSTYAKMILSLQNQDGSNNTDQTKQYYQGLCDNLKALSVRKERMSDPWYAGNNPIDIALAESEDAKFYARREHLTPAPNCRGACLRRINDYNAQAASRPANGREHMDVAAPTGDARFAIGNQVYYDIGSQVNDITRTYGTVAQKTRYPQYTDLIKYGFYTLPPLPPTAVKKDVSTDFTPPSTATSGEHFTSDPFLSTVAGRERFTSDPFLDTLKPK
jgi:hypothetical protein